MKNLKIVNLSTLLLTAALSLSVMNCAKSGSSPTASDPGVSNSKMATLKFHTVLNTTGVNESTPVTQNGALQKTSTIVLDRLTIQLTSSTQDTINDVILNPELSATSTSAQTLTRNYTLKSLRTWKVVATTTDTRGYVIHSDSATTSQMNPADTAVVSLNMNSKYTMYEAKFLSIPGVMSSNVNNTGVDVLNLKRFVFKVDGVIVMDSTKTVGYFAPGSTTMLAFDYVTTGANHTITLLAYTDAGGLHSWDASLPLYSGSVIINTVSGTDASTPVTLNWVGPQTGTGKLSATLGKVGKVTVNGTLVGSQIN